MVDRLDASLLTGGSAFGLAAGDGVMRWCAEQGSGFPTGAGPVPIVVTIGAVRPPGRRRLGAARTGRGVRRERRSAGRSGAARTDRRGNRAHDREVARARPCRGPGGSAARTVARRRPRRERARGAQRGRRHRRRRGARLGRPPPPETVFGTSARGREHHDRTDRHERERSTRRAASLVAQGGHDGLARALVPSHTRGDGDAIVAAATGRGRGARRPCPVPCGAGGRASGALGGPRGPRATAWVAWSTVLTLDAVAHEAATCTRCPLALGRTQVVFGMGRADADLLFVGEGPGAEEDRQGLPFVGRSGKLLDRLLEEELGITRAECYIANVVKCRPPENRDPRPEEIDACRPWFAQQLELIAPEGHRHARATSRRSCCSRRARASRSCAGAPTRSVRRCSCRRSTPPPRCRGGAEPLAQMRADFVRAKLALGRMTFATLRSKGVGDTQAVAGAVASLARRATSSSSSASSASGRRRSCRASPAGSG